ncbi:globin domain-containing protein [Spirosoma sp. KNUC1025]|uniref:globin domain-containing protein n=1 Tax=Spirosoma sp. KNUC1025 TaxID=2894082 RepID=UPI00386A2864|nr:globin domain-containing protein [Spirosoma sp. KNUC1025]
MTDQQIQIVKKTWRLLRGVDPHLLGDVFYRRLFMEFPGVRLLFKGPMDAQYEKFVAMLSFIVARIDRPDALLDEVVDLAKRHEGYGVKPFHYQLVGEALLWTLEQGLGREWNEEVRQAWRACYDSLTRSMLGKE